MKHVIPSVAAVVLLAGLAGDCAWGASDAVVAGVVRDNRGSPQMGALVELLGPESTVLARALTDDHGHYLFSHIVPGTYKLRASAAFLLPAMRSNLSLHAGTRALADLTMTAIFEAGSWLPTEARSPVDHTDDWRWALRSTANRPMLRLVNDRSPNSATSSSSLEHARPAVNSGEFVVLAGDGRFGDGGTHQVVSMGKAGPSGDISSVTANVGDNAGQGVNSSVTLAGSLEHDRGGGSQTHLYASFASHPELQTSQASGVGVLQVATTQMVTLGDAVIVDAGTLLTAERLAGSRFSSAPYLRVALQPSPGLAVEYRLATSRGLQASSDLEGMDVPMAILSDAQGRPLLERGMHQELSVSQSGERARITFGVFHDRIPFESLDGGGVLREQDIIGLPAVADPTTDTVRIAVRGYSAAGARVVLTEVLSPVLSATVEAQCGKAIANSGDPSMHLVDVADAVHARTAVAVRGSLRGVSKRTGTSASVRYRWQPAHTLTQVDEYDAPAGEAFLGVSFRQRLWTGRRLQRLSAVVDASNLLAQGYEPILGADGQTLFLAQVPRSVQGGFALSF